MGESKTRGDGTFEVQGSSHEFTSIDPKINIYHDCDDELTVRNFYSYTKSSCQVRVFLGKCYFLKFSNFEYLLFFQPCQRKISIMIPDSYVFSGGNPDDVYDAGTIELSGKFSGEERDCFH